MIVKDNEKNYISPSCKVIEVKAQAIICQSGGNESPYEENWEDGGFS